MKSQIKRFSKSTLSVILSLCMLVSCMTVGLIATDAAQTVAERVGAVDNSESVGADISNGTTFYLDVTNFSGTYNSSYWLSLSGNEDTTATSSDTSGAGSYVPKNDTSWVQMTKVRGNIYSATTTAASTNGRVSFWSKNESGYNAVWEVNVSLGNLYDGTKNLFTISSDPSTHTDRRAVCFNGTWSVYDPANYHYECPASVLNGTDIMFYIKGHNGDNVLTNGASHQQQTGATFTTVDNGGGYAYVQAPKSGVASYQYITNNPTGWNGNQNTDIGTSSAGKLHKADSSTSTTPAKTATTTPSTTSITTGTASITLSTECDSTTGVYNSLPLYYQYYLDDTYVASSEKSAQTTEQSFTLDTASLTEGSHTVKTVLTDGNIFYIANTETITVSDAAVPSIDTFTIGSSTLNIGETTTISSTKSNSTNSVTYAVTAGADVISLTGTTVKALKPGSATITASLTGATSKTVTVTVRTPTLTVTYDPASIYVGGDSTSAPTVTATNVNADTTISSKSFTKSGSAGTINASTGVVTSSASTTGSVTVTATATVTYNGVSYTSATGTATVTVKDRETVYLLGLTNEYTWNKTDSGDKANKMSYNSTTGLYEITMNLYSINSTTYTGNNGFQIDVDNSRFSKTYTLTTNATSTTLAAANNNNLAITTKDTDTNTAPYKFTYSTDTKNLTVYYPGIVTFNANGHGTAPAKKVVAYNETTTAPTAPTATGYTFGGWYKEAACTNAWDFSTDTVTEDTVLYAKWTQDSYAITYPTETNFSISNKSHASSAHYGDTVSFTVTASSGYRITGVTYTPTGGSAQNCTAGSNNTYSFTMPAANVTISVSTVQTYTVTLTAGEGFDSRQYKLESSGTYQSYTSGTTLTVDAGTDVYFKVTYSNGYEYDTNSGLTVATNYTVFRTGSVTANKSVSITAKKSTYNLTGVVSPTQGGTVTFYSNAACTSQITTAQIGNTFYAKYNPTSDYYTISSFSKSGTGLSNPTNTSNANIKKFTMGYSDATITANVVATTPELTCTGVSDGVYAGESFTYSGASVTPAASANNLTLSYTFPYNGSGSVTNSTGAFTAPTRAGTYKLLITATCQPPGITSANAVTVTQEVNIVVKYRESSVTYYVDMHNNTVNSLTFAIVGSAGGSPVLTDNNGNPCSATLGASGVYQLTKQGNSTVYAATISTPITQTNGSYNDVYFRITFNGTNYTKNISPDKVATLISTHEMWLEAENEASTPLTVNYSTRSTSTVPEGSRRIYVAKPYSWETSETNWATLGIYHWGNYTDIGWSNGIRMNYLGNSGSDGYHYYYADIPKAINGNKVSNIIFQGWNSTNPAAGTSPNAQTGNIENIPDSANFFYLSKEDGSFVGTKSEEDAVIANYTRYVSSVTMNKTEQTEVNIKPTYTGADVTYTSGDERVVTVDSNGKITPRGRGTTNITVKIYGTIGSLLTTEDNDHKDYITYPVSVTVKDPTQFNGFEIMSFESKTYTVNIPAVSGNQPGYFDMSNVVMTVEGIHGVTSSTSSAIITQTSTASVTGVGTVCTAFTVQYAKANSDFTGYNNIRITGKTVTKSIKIQGDERYGHDHWEVDDVRDDTIITTRKIYSGTDTSQVGIETATTNGIPFNSAKATYSDIFAAYSYVDVTFTFNYYEYKPKKVDADGNVVADNVEGMIQYPYDSTWAGGEVTSNANFAASHTQKTFTVSNYEVRGKTADNITTSDLATAAATAIGVMPSNNYYTYSIAAANTTKTKTGTYTANSTVNMTQNIRRYSVYLNGTTVVGTNYTYQQYAEPSVNNASDWYAVDSSAQNASTDNAPLLATNVNSYKFRVKGDTYLRTKTATNPRGYDFIRSEVDFSHYEVVHRENPQHNVVDYLMQNFYIADFFSPSEVLDPNSYSGKGKFGPAYKVETVTESTSTSSGNITVYFTDSLDWNDIHIYYWGENINNVNWPGSVMTQSGTDGDGKKIYSAVIPGTAEGVIFTGNNNQTVDITNNIANGSHWKSKNEIVRNGIPYDDAQFVGGGVVYYSMNGATENNQGTPFANAVSSGYVNGSDGKINTNAVKEMLKSNIEAQYAKDNIAGAVGENEAMKIAYGTEIAATKNKEGGFNTGIIYRYLPLNQYKRDGNGTLLAPDQDGNYAYDVNTNTFRYSNSLQSYQYVYASGNENKETNTGKNMRLYSYFVYSYTAYNQETNVPETRYEIVISDNYSDASTYWEGNPNPDPSN